MMASLLICVVALAAMIALRQPAALREGLFLLAQLCFENRRPVDA